MLTIPTDPDLNNRLTRVARALGKSPEHCALAALKAWLCDHEEAMATSQRLGGAGVARPPADFYD